MSRKVIALVPAAGAGVRMGPGPAKQFRHLAGVPLLVRTLEALERSPVVQEVVVAAPPHRVEQVRAEYLGSYAKKKPVSVVPGGATRQMSVHHAALEAARRGGEWVLIHDGVRPLASPQLFEQVLAAAQEHGAAVAALPSGDTVKKSGPGDLVSATLTRERIWLVQTPQGFLLDRLLRAQAKAAKQGFTATDEAGLLEWDGVKVKLVKGEVQNIKITTPADLRLAKGWLWSGEALMRVGQGMDIHRLVAGRRLVLGGVEITNAKGLLGHSDADVLTHALMDALLAAAGLGDIGRHFPDSNPAYKDASSLVLLEEVVAKLAALGWRPAQASVTVAAQAPKLTPHFPAMRENLSSRLELEPGLINLAATTGEGLGFTGRGEGLAAWALAVIHPD